VDGALEDEEAEMVRPVVDESAGVAEETAGATTEETAEKTADETTVDPAEDPAEAVDLGGPPRMLLEDADETAPTDDKAEMTEEEMPAIEEETLLSEEEAT
jgi:hypothetical protein